MLTIAQDRVGDKVASCSHFSNTHATSTPLSSSELGLRTPVRLGRSSFDISSNTRQQQRLPNPSRFQGNWTGIVTGVGTPSYAYRINLRRSGKSTFVGTSEITSLTDPSIFGVMSLGGRVVNGALLFKETRITNQNPPLGSRWCFKGGRLRISASNGRTFLRGPWSDPGCNSGQIRLRKQ